MLKQSVRLVRAKFAPCLLWAAVLLLFAGSAHAETLKPPENTQAITQQSANKAATQLVPGQAPKVSSSNMFKPSKEPVHFSAKELSHDDKNQTVTATGDVELIQGEKILRADKMIYHLDTDTVQAIGNVSLLDDNGDVHFAEYVQLTKDMKNGFVQGLLSLLSDGSRFTAVEGLRQNGTKMTMTDATYTACHVCEADPHPLWQIKAAKVVHDEADHTVKYTDAKLEFDGVPLAFAPIFSHADPSVKRKTGFLRPTAGYSSTLGAFAEEGFYWDVAPDKDATIVLKPTTREGTLAQAEWRERFANGKIDIDLSGAQSNRLEENGTITHDADRGSIFADGLFDLSQTWRAGIDVQRVSDKQFLRLYDISDLDVLDSDIYAERLAGRDYTRVSAVTFQDVRLGAEPEQPALLPMMETSFIGEPNSVLGGRWNVGGGLLGLSRQASGQDVQRAGMNGGWQRRDIFTSGITSLVSLQGRGDFYAVQQSDASKLDPALPPDTNTLRGIATATAEMSYPMVRRLSDTQLMVAPVVSLNASPVINENDTKVPNEDSIDTELDINNLFSDNRFPGIDREEDGVRANYGMRLGDYGDNGRYVKTFFGQSYRFRHDTAFPQGSGLEGHASDYVGEVDAGISKYLNADYHFQLDNNLAVRRHELQTVFGNDTISAAARYIFITDIAGTGFTEPRQQAEFGGKYRFREHWYLAADSLTDIGTLDPGLRKASFSLNYADECFTFTMEGVRNLLQDQTGDNGTTVLFRVGFKNIGEFSAPNIQLTQTHDINQQ